MFILETLRRSNHSFLTYAAEIWGLHDTKQIEKVHTFAIK